MTLPAAPVPETTPELLYLLAADPDEFADVAGTLPPADIADALRRLPPEPAAKVLAALPYELAVRVLDEPELEYDRAGIIGKLELPDAGRLIDAMSADQQADLFRDLPPNERERLLPLLNPHTRRGLTLLLQYEPDTAGGMMTTEFLSVATTASAAETMELIKRVSGNKETVYSIYVTDPASGALAHVVSLRELLVADPGTPMGKVGTARTVLSVRPHTDREDVARFISKYNLLAAPVIDRERKILGIVTVDDVLDALVREGTEDVQKFGGVAAFDEPYTEMSFVAMIRKRAGWLCVLFLSEMLTATAMQHFEGELAQAVVLTLFIPLIMSSGGNSGSQATSLIIRALAIREITVKDWWRVAVRELPSGLVLGAILGVIGIARISLWQNLHLYDYGPHWWLVALTVGCALVGVVTFGSLAGSMLPFALKRLGFDPASASAPFVATLVDVTGIVIYFEVAAHVLRGTLL
jgi:magnesium transporter